MPGRNPGASPCVVIRHTNTIIPDPYNPLDWDRYAYARNNPVRYTDPTGHDVDCGLGDSYCNDVSREYYRSDLWRKNIHHKSYKDFLRGKDAYYFYYQHPDIAFDGIYLGEEKRSVLQALLYSENALRQGFEPIPEFMVWNGLDQARASDNRGLFYKLLAGLGITEWMSADKGFGGGYGTSWTFGSFKSQQKWTNQITKRGWTIEQIDEAILYGEQFQAVNNINPSNPATRFVHPVTGRPVVIDDMEYFMWEVMVLYTPKHLIYIRLLNEGTLVYRTTEGEKLEELVFKVLPTENYDPDDEQWEFPPGKVVRCVKERKGESEVLIAVEEV